MIVKKNFQLINLKNIKKQVLNQRTLGTNSGGVGDLVLKMKSKLIHFENIKKILEPSLRVKGTKGGVVDAGGWNLKKDFSP